MKYFFCCPFLSLFLSSVQLPTFFLHGIHYFSFPCKYLSRSDNRQILVPVYLAGLFVTNDYRGRHATFVYVRVRMTYGYCSCSECFVLHNHKDHSVNRNEHCRVYTHCSHNNSRGFLIDCDKMKSKAFAISNNDTHTHTKK